MAAATDSATGSMLTHSCYQCDRRRRLTYSTVSSRAILSPISASHRTAARTPTRTCLATTQEGTYDSCRLGSRGLQGHFSLAFPGDLQVCRACDVSVRRAVRVVGQNMSHRSPRAGLEGLGKRILGILLFWTGDRPVHSWLSVYNYNEVGVGRIQRQRGGLRRSRLWRPLFVRAIAKGRVLLSLLTIIQTPKRGTTAGLTTGAAAATAAVLKKFPTALQRISF